VCAVGRWSTPSPVTSRLKCGCSAATTCSVPIYGHMTHMLLKRQQDAPAAPQNRRRERGNCRRRRRGPEPGLPPPSHRLPPRTIPTIERAQAMSSYPPLCVSCRNSIYSQAVSWIRLEQYLHPTTHAYSRVVHGVYKRGCFFGGKAPPVRLGKSASSQPYQHTHAEAYACICMHFEAYACVCI